MMSGITDSNSLAPYIPAGCDSCGEDALTHCMSKGGGDGDGDGGFGDPNGYGDNYGQIGVALSEGWRDASHGKRDAADVCCHFKCNDRDEYDLYPAGTDCDRDTHSEGCVHEKVPRDKCAS